MERLPAEWFNEPDWTSGKSVDSKIYRANGEPVMIAGLWDTWRSKITDERINSFTMLTVNADDPLMKRFHRPGEEKRMLVILKENEWEPWLDAKGDETRAFMRQLSSDNLVAEPPVPAAEELQPSLI